MKGGTTKVLEWGMTSTALDERLFRRLLIKRFLKPAHPRKRRAKCREAAKIRDKREKEFARSKREREGPVAGAAFPGRTISPALLFGSRISVTTQGNRPLSRDILKRQKRGNMPD